ncbi:MAG: hypothetical protein JNL04_20890 [Rhodospirillaceae bacterium]|nr:hypothetical protein [Rhodospirillaceae bacterium]
MAAPERPAGIVHWREVEKPENGHYDGDDEPTSIYNLTATRSTSSTVAGEAIVYPAGKAVVTSAFVVMAPGERTICIGTACRCSPTCWKAS